MFWLSRVMDADSSDHRGLLNCFRRPENYPWVHD